MNATYLYVKSFFNGKIVVCAVLLTLVIFVLGITSAYQVSANKINSVSMQSFGVKVSSEFDLLTVLPSEKFNYLSEFLISLIFSFVSVPATFNLVKKFVIDEKHIGWKRLGITVPVFFVFWWMMLTPKIISSEFNHLMAYFSVIVIVPMVIVIISISFVAIIHWIFRGFEKS